MSNRQRFGPQWQEYVGQHFNEWEQRSNRSIHDRLQRVPPSYNNGGYHVPPQQRLSRNDHFVQNPNGSVFNRLAGAPKGNKESKRHAEQQSKLSRRMQWRLRNAEKNQITPKEIELKGSTLEAITAISKAPADTTDWDVVIQEALDSVQITQEEIDQKERVLGLIEEALKAKYPRAICRLFGSSETKLDFKDYSDADIYASLGYDPYHNTNKKEGKSKAAKLTRELGFCLKKHPELILSGTIPHCRVPLVKLFHKPSKTRVVLSFRLDFGVSNSSVVRLLCDSHPQVRPFLLFLKLWATAHNISGPGRHNNLLSSYALSLLALFTCMAREQKLVPSLEDLRKQPYDSNVIDEWEAGYGTDVTAYWQQQEEGPPASVEGGVLALALEFFEMYAELDYMRWAVCPMVGKLVSRDALQASDNAAPAGDGGETADAGDADSDWGETDYEVPAATVEDDSAMITDNGTDEPMITDAATTAAVATDDAATTAAVATDDAAATAAVATDDAAATAAVTTDDAATTAAVATDDAATTATVATDDAATTAAVATDDAATTAAVATDDAATTAAVATDDAATTAAVATDDAATTAAVATDDAAATAAVTTDDAAATAAVTTDDAATTAAVATDDATEDMVTTDSVTTDVAISADAVSMDSVTTNEAVVTDTSVTTDIVEKITTDSDAKSGEVTSEMEIAEDTPAITDGINDNVTAGENKDTATGSVADKDLPEALLPHLAKMKNSNNKKVPLCVLDIFALDTNVTHHYRLENVKSFQEKCRMSAKIIKEVQKQEKPLSALFPKLNDSE